MKKSGKRLSGFSKGIGKATKFLAGFGVALGGAAIIGFVRNTMQMMDATGKMADRLKMSTEALVGFRHAAEISGVEAAALDKSLQMFVRRLGEVRMGSGEAKDALKALNLNADALVRMRPDQAFRVVAEGIKGMGTQADKAAAAYKLFGRQGQQLLNMFELGAGGLNQMQREAEALGLTFSRIDAARIEAANDAMTRLAATTKKLGQTLAIEVAPYIEGLEAALGGIKREKARGEQLGLPTTEIKTLEAKRRELLRTPSIGFLGKGPWETDAKELADIDRKIAMQLQRSKEFQKQLIEQRKPEFSFSKGIEPALQPGGTGTPWWQEQIGGIRKIGQSIHSEVFGAWEAVQKKQAETAAQLARQMKASIAATRSATRTAGERYTARMGELKGQLAGGLDQESYNRAAKQAQDSLVSGIAGEAPGRGGRTGVLESARVSIEALKIGRDPQLEAQKKANEILARIEGKMDPDGGGLN